ncbi:MAG TPA: tRNA (adenosine(37)-N6)-threonylcarbamoyltransferase complex transferase subunit TsaD [Candidatus Saccharimonadales bacterium]|nr:tRNA (adenosine(37)-N6)-threonylcarbamoyltransferase complex transferase subunit TsaD [Candidatus Saccharimonadales bacterium]
MRILGIETSCDETAASIIEGKKDHVLLRSTVLATSLALHAKTGGIIPEQAAREQVKYILPVLKEALTKADCALEEIDTVAVTYGPGLIGSLLVGVETAKTLSFVLNKPLIPVNHMVGHIYANFIKSNSEVPAPDIKFPLLALVVSGGHTDLLLMKKHGDFNLLGGTRDDAAGEAFDKIGRMLGLAYPAGPAIERLAKKGDPKRFRFPRPLLHEDTYEFSFSGLKTAVLREVTSLGQLDTETLCDLARATQDAIADVLVKKTLRAAKEHRVQSLLLSGGVAANQTLRDTFEQTIRDQKLPLNFFVPPRNLCTDNAAMIASAAYFNFNPIPWKDITADPELYFE